MGHGCVGFRPLRHGDPLTRFPSRLDDRLYVVPMLSDCATFQGGLPFALILPAPRLPERLLLAVKRLHQYMPPSTYRRLPVTCCGSCRNRFVPVPVLGTEFRFSHAKTPAPWAVS